MVLPAIGSWRVITSCGQSFALLCRRMNELGKDLCTAAFMGSQSFLEDVLSVSDASTANLTDDKGDTPLHRAVLAGQLECAHILLEHQGTVPLIQHSSHKEATVTSVSFISLTITTLLH